ncbi:MAG: acyl carrier protein [Halioglobus sp.]
MTTEAKIIDIIQEILKHQAFPETVVTIDSPLYDDGVGLDSLCVAELSATLEKHFGKDPYTSGTMPQTVSDIVAFYGDR